MNVVLLVIPFIFFGMADVIIGIRCFFGTDRYAGDVPHLVYWLGKGVSIIVAGIAIHLATRHHERVYGREARFKFARTALRYRILLLACVVFSLARGFIGLPTTFGP